MEKVKSFFSKMKSSILNLYSKIKKSIVSLIDKIKKMDKKKKIILLVVSIIILILIITGICLLIFSGKKETSMGNLNNKGIAATSGGDVYFHYFNTNIEEDGNVDNNGLYEMSGNKLKMLDKQSLIRSVNVSGNWVYYVSIDEQDYHREIIKISKNGKNKTVLVDDIEAKDPSGGEMLVHGNNIYFIGSGYKLETMKKNGKDRKQLSNEEMISFQIVDKEIYFLSLDYELKKMSINGENIEDVTSINITSFQVEEDSVYYIDKSDENLKKMDLNGENVSSVIDGVVRYYNITDGNLYYQKTSEDNTSSIYKMNLKKNEETKVVDLSGSYTTICIVGKWMYYVDKIENNYYYYTVYRVKTNGDKKEMISIK